MKMSDSITELAKALVAAQKELPTILKDRVARTEKFSYAYVGLDTVMPEALKVLTKHGLSIVQPVGRTEDGFGVLTTMLLHTSGEYIADAQPLLLARNDAQGQGSAITYARRYGLMSMIGLVADDDDDGNQTSAPRQSAPPQQSATPPQQQGRPAPPQPARQAPDPRADGEINKNQIKAIRASLADLFGKDEQAQWAWLKDVAPKACETTTIHLSGLTVAEASAVIRALNAERDSRKAQPAQAPLPAEA